jgi:membrane peptidoglycan carboxypeptidase
VHGIAVSGGSFPAEIWRLFMQPALEGAEATAFPEPTRWPTWQPFTRGEYALTYDPSAAPTDTTEEETTEPGKPEGPPPRGIG